MGSFISFERIHISTMPSFIEEKDCYCTFVLLYSSLALTLHSVELESSLHAMVTILSDSGALSIGEMNNHKIELNSPKCLLEHHCIHFLIISHVNFVCSPWETVQHQKK